MSTSAVGLARRARIVLSLAFRNEHALIAFALVILVVGFTAGSKVFLTPANISDILLETAVYLPFTVGMGLVLIVGEIDLSVGANIALSGILAATLMVHSVSLPIAVLCGLLLGLAIGLFNGYFTAYFGIPSFMVTLAMQGMARGGSLVMT